MSKPITRARVTLLGILLAALIVSIVVMCLNLPASQTDPGSPPSSQIVLSVGPHPSVYVQVIHLEVIDDRASTRLIINVTAVSISNESISFSISVTPGSTDPHLCTKLGCQGITGTLTETDGRDQLPAYSMTGHVTTQFAIQEDLCWSNGAPYSGSGSSLRLHMPEVLMSPRDPGTRLPMCL